MNELNCSCFRHIINILLTELNRSVWENLELGRVYRSSLRTVCTHDLRFGLYLPPRSRFSHTDRLSSVVRANYWYYLASLASGKMNQTQRFDWLPEGARESVFPVCDYSFVHFKKNCALCYTIKSPLYKFVL